MSAKSAAAVSAPRIQETKIWQPPKETDKENAGREHLRLKTLIHYANTLLQLDWNKSSCAACLHINKRFLYTDLHSEGVFT